MRLKDVSKHLAEFSREAKRVLDETGADHVLYGVKLYDDNDELEEVKFYILPMTDEVFEEGVANKRGIIVYAHHKMK